MSQLCLCLTSHTAEFLTKNSTPIWPGLNCFLANCSVSPLDSVDSDKFRKSSQDITRLLGHMRCRREVWMTASLAQDSSRFKFQNRYNYSTISWLLFPSSNPACWARIKCRVWREREREIASLHGRQTQVFSPDDSLTVTKWIRAFQLSNYQCF